MSSGLGSEALPTRALHTPARIVKTGVALLAIQGVTWVSTLVSLAVAPRFLGPKDFGVLVTATTIGMLLAALAGMGTNNLVVKRSARYPESTAGLVVNTIMARLSVWAALVAIGFIPCIIAFEPGPLLACVVVAALGVPISLALDTLIAGLQGNHLLGSSSRTVAFSSLSGQLVLAAGLVAGAGVVFAAASGILANGLSLIVIWFIFRRNFTGSRRIQLSVVRNISQEARTYFAWDVGQRLYASSPLLVISLLGGTAVAGSFAVATRLMSIPIFITTIITMSIYPTLAASAHDNEAWFGRVVRQSLRLSVVLTVPMSLTIAVFAGPLTSLLTGSQFDDAPQLISILALSIPFVAVNTVLGMSLFALDRQRLMAILMWTASFISILGLVIVFRSPANLPGLTQAQVAVSVVLLVESTSSVIVWKWAKQRLAGNISILDFLKPVSCALIMVMAALVLREIMPWWCAAPLAVATYVLFSVVLGSVTVSELSSIKHKFSRSPEPA